MRFKFVVSAFLAVTIMYILGGNYLLSGNIWEDSSQDSNAKAQSLQDGNTQGSESVTFWGHFLPKRNTHDSADVSPELESPGPSASVSPFPVTSADVSPNINYPGNSASSIEEKIESSALTPEIPVEVENKAEAITGREVAAEDYIEAAGAILGKLSLSEIKFIFGAARSDFWVATPIEEIEKVRGIIFSKLTAADITTLKELGRKYGRSMTILDPDIDVAKTKEKQVSKK